MAENTALATAKTEILAQVETRINELQRAGKLHFPANYSPQNALQAANPVRQKVQPLRGGMPAGGAAEPQNLQEAMFGGM